MHTFPEGYEASSRNRGCPRPLYVFFGHHYCGTTWITRILQEACAYLGWRFRVIHHPGDWATYGSLGRFVSAERPDVLVCTQATLQQPGELPAFRAFHVVRDPRDVVVLRYRQHLKRPLPEHLRERARQGRMAGHLAHCARLQELPAAEGLLLEMAYSEHFFRHMREWDYGRPEVLELKYETLFARPEATFWQVFSFLGFLVPVQPGPLYGLSLRFNRWYDGAVRRLPSFVERRCPRLVRGRLPAGWVTDIVRRVLAGRSHPGEGPERSLPERMAPPPLWRTCFDEMHIAYFKEKYNNLLIQLGYETDPGWC
ncbi:sulfotransferase domain-containing protein [Rhodocaloribacter litoris]|uniref:sulfotransferase domain-containing protein n=1 Tax=Rhodocaloribacter litoris TaxID=2558931 RepID=UPI00142411A8|nr:sulfotransferase domain-containing protein [Rhodocaloribacter litoris]QXD14704.1 sulfotransferase domain-containing protein [Rhodocaloribacter litoris]